MEFILNEHGTVVLKFLLVFICTVFFGIERHRSHKPVGFGTFIFVGLGSCAIGVIVWTLGVDKALSLMSAAITGIGFLGAGALIKGSDRVFGFTTAAAVWVCAIFGLAVGVGEYFVGILTYVFIWFVVLYDAHLERKGIGSYQKKLTIVANTLIKDTDVLEHFKKFTAKHKKISVNIDKKNNQITIVYLVESSKENINQLIQQLYREEWFDSCKVD